ncbi:MAG: hypothetical protein ACK4IX_08695 [Candidatus Sericytochromatia bacterium]
MRIIIDGLSKIGKSFLFNELIKYTKKIIFMEPKYNECELQSLTIIDRQKKFVETYSKITKNAMKYNSFVMYRSIVSVNVYNTHYFKLRLKDDIDNNSILDNIATLQKLSPLVIFLHCSDINILKDIYYYMIYNVPSESMFFKSLKSFTEDNLDIGYKLLESYNKFMFTTKIYDLKDFYNGNVVDSFTKRNVSILKDILLT